MTARSATVVGWDIGGAHLKAVALSVERELQLVRLQPCPLWQGLHHLTQAMAQVLAELPNEPLVHAVTMTGELCDLFGDREEGVARILACVRQSLPLADVRVYARESGLIRIEQATATGVASMNWHAMARALCDRLPVALLIDIGSTTTDIVSIADGRIADTGVDDRTRLASDELVYQGVVRTPVMALCARVPYRGQWQGMAAEVFATTADVYRLLDALPADADLQATADGRGKSVAESAARLARMVGDDDCALAREPLRDLAAFLRDCQVARLREAVARVGGACSPASIIGAGVGRFLAQALARSLGRPYGDYAGALGFVGDDAARATDCAPALAVACLALANQ